MNYVPTEVWGLIISYLSLIDVTEFSFLPEKIEGVKENIPGKI